MSKGLDAKVAEIERLYAAGRTMGQIARAYGVSKQSISALMRRHGIAARPIHCRRKGDDVSYTVLHARVRQLRGAPSRCEECGTTDPAKRYEWANLTGNYADPRDYRRLCVACHRRYDHGRLGSPGSVSAIEASKRIGVSPTTLRGLCRAGVIAAQKAGASLNSPYRITERAIADYLGRQTVEATPVTRDEWLAAALAAAPPLTQAQVAALRPVFAPVIPHMHAAPAATGAAPARTDSPTERTMQ